MRVILVTGGAGFVGSNFIRYFLRRNKDFVIVNMDNLNYASNLKNLKELERSPRYHFVKGSICNQELVNYVVKRHRPDYILNFADESERSNNSFVASQTNLTGTVVLLESAKYFWGKHNYSGNRFIQVSTTEVYGCTKNNDEFFTEESALSPQNLYSASKAGADLIVKSFNSSYGFPSIITRCCLNYGPFQHPDKFIPSGILNTIEGKHMMLDDNNSYSREWIHVIDHCVALIRVMFYGKPGEIYNIGSGNEISDADMAKKILSLMGKAEDIPEPVIRNPELQMRNAVNSYKARNNLGWGPRYKLEDGLKDTIQWYKTNSDWWNDLPE